MLRGGYFDIFLVVLACIPRLSYGNCEVDSFAVQENFDIKKYLGTWYGMQWVPPPLLDPSLYYRDYVHVLTEEKNSNIKILVAKRDAKIEKCYYSTNYLNETSTPGKLLWQDANGTVFNYWVMDTDYDNYSIVYNCDRKNPVDGTCISPEGWIWGRRHTLTEQQWQYIDSKLESLCVNLTTMAKSLHIEDCPDPNGATSYLQSHTAVFSFLILYLAYYLTTY